MNIPSPRSRAVKAAVTARLLAVLLCSGCTQTYVSGEAIASNQAVEAETNSILVTNILRARDGVPTYFSDISHLRGSLQAQASIQAPLGVGDYKSWTGRSLVAPGAYVQVNPSFDVAPLNTQGFTRGINEPLDVRVFQYYLDRAISPYTLLELFVDKVEDVRYEGGHASITPYYNIPCEDQAAHDCGLRSLDTGERYFDAKIRDWTRPYLFLNPYKLLLPYGPPFAVGGKQAPALRDFSGVAANSALTLRPVDGPGSRTYRLYTVSNNVAFCVGSAGAQDRNQLNVTVHAQDGSQRTQAYQVIRIARNTVGGAAATVSESVDPSACIKSEVYADYEAPAQSTGAYTVLHFRSVDGMIEFLGRMLRVPPHLRPLQFEVSADDPATARFSVPYEGQRYYIHDRRHSIASAAGCSPSAAAAIPRCEDRTLEILTLVNQLLNLNKNQSELPATGAVQVVN